ncbi:MAG: glycosyltransferase [Treponema sp.]|nr:glycosyltransferase [Treponema sp.]
MNNPLVSVIVPVYKVEQYLHKCVDSVLNQTYTNLEIILVDDGSPDNCPAICDEYAAKDSRVRMIHKENGGLSDARNAGIKIANGEWILYVDSDDYIEPDSVERLLSCVKEAAIDVVVGVAKEIKLDGRICFQRHTNLKDGEILPSPEYICKSIKNNEWYAPAWLNLYKTSFIRTNELYFVKGLLYEDLEMLPRTFLAAHNVLYIDYPFYNYISRPHSIMNSKKNEKNLQSVKFIMDNWKKNFDSVEDSSLRKMLYHWMLRNWLILSGKFQIVERYYPSGTNAVFMLLHCQNLQLFIKTMVLIASPRLYSFVYSCKYKEKC